MIGSVAKTFDGTSNKGEFLFPFGLDISRLEKHTKNILKIFPYLFQNFAS